MWNLLKTTPKMSQYLGATIEAAQMAWKCVNFKETCEI